VSKDSPITRHEHASTSYITTEKPAYTHAAAHELKAIIKQINPTHYWSPDPRILPPRHLPVIFMIQELTTLLMPQDVSWFKRWRLNRRIQNNLLLAHAVVCTSHALKVRMIATYGYFLRRKLEVIHNGVHPLFRKHTVAEITHIRRQFLIPKSYIIMVGDAPNVFLTPLRALGRAEEVAAFSCVIVGPKTLQADLRETIRDCHLEGLIRFIDDETISYQQLSTLYSGATVTFESTQRGDYRPTILQSLASGTPVICAAGNDVHELYGNAVLGVHPTQASEWAKAYESIILSASLRERLIERGERCVEEKRWSIAWQKLLSIILELS
jgi:alpha-1,3-rhamnosyl/mannosyltransferase